MKKFADLFLRALGFNRPKPKTHLGRLLRRSERALTIAALLYVGLQFYPQALFAYSVSAHGMTVYSRSPLPVETFARINEARSLVDRSELAAPGRNEHIFLCNSPWIFRLFLPLSAGAFAYSVPLTDNVFIADADVTQNVVHRTAVEFNTRVFAPVVAHEITHGLIRRRLGLMRGLLLPAWVAEGYCDYIAHDSSFPEAEGLRLLASDGSHPSSSFRYFTYRQMVSHLIEDRHFSFEQVVARAHEAGAVETETRRTLRELAANTILRRGG